MLLSLYQYHEVIYSNPYYTIAVLFRSQENIDRTMDKDVENIEESPECNGDNEKEEKKGVMVKSRAIVQHDLVQSPTQFAQLQNNTNLNLPPPNWLRRYTVSSYEWLNILRGQWGFPRTSNNSYFASFDIAKDFPDSVGDVDIITDAENIKRLLKLPYGNGAVSMIVHRIGKTLFIDNFDIHLNLLRTSQNEWNWLRNFYVVYLAQMFNKKFLGKADRSRNRLQAKDLFSKFLHYSVADQVEEDTETTNSEVNKPKTDFLKESCDNRSDTYPLSITALQESVFNIEFCTHEENLRRGSQPKHLRNVLWTFEDIHMLIGSDMPIFGCGTHPAVSLRLRETTEPITVLTGIDYWLDNLMSNVPELVMCCHLDGKVQKYHMFKTEEIPNLENSRFSPEVVNNIAQNILSFLKTNATKCGHTYWLLGGAGTETDMVKLYDLTSLCNDIGDEPGRNPYTGPVANLLFKMAKVLSKEIHKKMSNSKKASVDVMDAARDVMGAVRDVIPVACEALPSKMLLLLWLRSIPCFNTTAATREALNVASLKYFMADLFMPQASESSSEDESSDDSTEPEPEPIFTENSENTKENVTIESSPFIEMSKLSRPNYVNRKTKIRTSLPQLLKSEDWVKRCKESIKYIFEGLNCTLSRKQSEEYSEEAIPKPSIPIILPYESLKDTSNVSTSLKPEIHEQLDSNAKKIDFQHSSNEMPVSTFVAEYKEDVEKGKLHLIMFLKASHCYQFLGDEALSENNVGQAWKYAKLSLSCFEIAREIAAMYFKLIEKYYLIAHCKIYFQLLVLYSNIFLLLSEVPMLYDSLIEESNEKDLGSDIVAEYLPKTSKSSEFSFLHDVPTTFDYVKILGNSSKCLELAIELPCDFPKNIDIPKNLGNVLNLLGVYYMKETIALFTNENVEKIKEMSEKSQTSFNSAIKAFEKTTDNQYLILIYGNFAKLKRSLAHYHTADLEEKPSSRQIGQIEMQFFKQAIKLYERSLELLQSRKSENCSIWDSLSWDLSTTLLHYASLLQDNPPTKKYSVQWVEQETIRLMIQSLARCNIEGVEPSLPSKQRQAVINHRLGALYHCILRSLDSQSDNKKSNRTAAETHYIRAGELFLEINQPQDYIQVVLEHLGLLESYLKDLTSFQKKYITLEKMINMILQTSVVISDIKEFSKEDLKKNKNQDKGFPQAAKESTVSEKHVNFLVNQLMDSLKNMCKLIKTPREAVLVDISNGYIVVASP
ncbi:Erythroid differentiation-related factor 1 [Nymphon striatum]|nr:Erythroid differentiation-related factor 1 [Nymphon striatum]